MSAKLSRLREQMNRRRITRRMLLYVAIGSLMLTLILAQFKLGWSPWIFLFIVAQQLVLLGLETLIPDSVRTELDRVDLLSSPFSDASMNEIEWNKYAGFRRICIGSHFALGLLYSAHFRPTSREGQTAEYWQLQHEVDEIPFIFETEREREEAAAFVAKHLPEVV